MNLLLSTLGFLIALGLFLLFLLALLSPLEALGWWAGWSKRGLDPVDKADLDLKRYDDAVADAPHYVVYLTAIGGISTDDISSRERHFLALLADHLPDAMIVSDVFPFSVSNNPLNGERALSWLWQRLHNSRMQRHSTSFLSIFIFARNLFQVAVSADPRYGPINNVGVANEIAKSLYRHGYPLQSGKPITVMGWSGGGQIAVGAARYLHQALEAPVYVISIGGVLTDDPSIQYVEHLYHIQGSRDSFPKVGDILYPGRWKLLSYSAWNQALREGKITFIDPGPMRHTGGKDYFDPKSKLADGQTYVEKTTEIIAGIILGIPDTRPDRDIAEST